MTSEQRGIYRELIDHCWEKGDLSTDERILQKWARATDEEWARSWPVVRQMFRIVNGRYHLPKVDDKRSDISSLKTTRKYSGKLGAEAKWGTQSSATETRAERLRKAREKGTHTPAEWLQLCELAGNKCLRCGAMPVVKDHIIPIYQGGSDAIGNLQPLCSKCNSSKGPDNTNYVERAGIKVGELLSNAWQTPSGMPGLTRALPSPSPSPLPSPSTAAAVSQLLDHVATIPALAWTRLDAAAAAAILTGCRTADPECTVEEIGYALWTRAETAQRAGNPIGLLITATPNHFRNGGSPTLRKLRMHHAQTA